MNKSRTVICFFCITLLYCVALNGQELPNGVSFGGSVTKSNENIINLELWVHNGSEDPLKDVKLQTCAYLHGIEEFDQKTFENKLVHVAGQGWISHMEAREVNDVEGKYHVGWLSGPRVVDLPVILALAKDPGRLVAFTWFEAFFRTKYQEK